MDCKTHGCKMEIKWLDGYRDPFAGFYCPECEREAREAKVTYEAENKYWLDMVKDAEKMATQLRLRRPYDGFLEKYGWDGVNRWYAKMVKTYF